MRYFEIFGDRALADSASTIYKAAEEQKQNGVRSQLTPFLTHTETDTENQHV